MSMQLQPRLDRIRRGFEKQAPPEVLAVMHQVTRDLAASGILDRVAREGEPAPRFELENTRGIRVGLEDLLARGPVVLTFFRGHW